MSLKVPVPTDETERALLVIQGSIPAIDAEEKVDERIHR